LFAERLREVIELFERQCIGSDHIVAISADLVDGSLLEPLLLVVVVADDKELLLRLLTRRHSD